MTNSIVPVITYKVQPQRARVEPFDAKIQGTRGSCVLLHGWDSKGSDMAPLAQALQHLPSAVGWNFYTTTYETHSETFVEAARDLYWSIDSLPKPLILLGYSEGGVVARQLIVDGVQIKALVTICAPHLGLGTWMPTPDFGSSSVSPFSRDLQNLNASPVDSNNRQFYHLFAISCTDFWGFHNDDGVVPVPSALGTTLGTMAERTLIQLDYGDGIAGVDPHSHGMDPAKLQPVLDTCSQLFT